MYCSAEHDRTALRIRLHQKLMPDLPTWPRLLKLRSQLVHILLTFDSVAIKLLASLTCLKVTHRLPEVVDIVICFQVLIGFNLDDEAVVQL